ncbi:MAG: hypothetical protein ABIS26_01050 [Candidatus Paceibacterota bacterium]
MAKNFSKKFLVFLLLLSLFSYRNTSFALILVDTENVSISAQVGNTLPVNPGGGGSSGGSVGIPKTSVRFSGFAYPNGTVTLLKEGIELATVSSDSSGAFSITLEESFNKNILYSLFATDSAGNRSLLINYPIVVYTGYLTQLSGIRFPPTINIDKTEVKVGDYLTVSGYAVPNEDIELVIEGPEKKVFTLTTNNKGFYTATLPLGTLAKGDYLVSAKYSNDTRISKLVSFTIGDNNIAVIKNTTNIPGDCNVDHIINIVDFSILAFWYGKLNPPKCVDTNSDNTINLTDFSILAFYWTG